MNTLSERFLNSKKTTSAKSNNSKQILFVGQNFSRAKNYQLCRHSLDAVRIASKSVKLQIIIRPHGARSEYTSDEFYKQTIREASFKPSEVLLDRSDNLYDLIQASDIVVTASSTVHVEAVGLGKNVIMQNIDGIEPMEIVKQGAAIETRNVNELIDAILFYSKHDSDYYKRKTFLNEYVNGFTPFHLDMKFEKQLGYLHS